MLSRILVFVVVSVFASASALAQGLGGFDRTVVFGDSLSDNGNLFGTTGNPPAPYFNGRFSNGPVWIEQLLGPMNNPALGGSVGGNVNVAFGGARADNDANSNGPVPSHQTQVGIFLGAGGTFGENDLAVSWAGANDLFQGIPSASGQADLVALGTNTANDQLANVQSLAAAGARNILVANLPNIGAAPSFNGTAASSGAGFLSSRTFNQQLNTNLHQFAADNPNVNVIQMDVEAAFNAVLADPAAFGFTNVSEQCILVTSCVTGSVDQQNQFLFWDGVHPTQAGHALLAQYASLLFATGDASRQSAALSEAGTQGIFSTTENVFDRTQSWIDGSYARENGFHAELIGVQGDLDASGNRSATSFGLYGVRAGLDKEFGNALIGASAAILVGDTRGGALQADTMSFQTNLYGSVVSGPLYATGVASASFTQFNEIERRVGLGNVKAFGETESAHFGIAGEVGAILKPANGFAVIPSVRAGYVDGTLDGYDEQAAVLALSYADRDTSVAFWSAEVRASADTSFGTVYGEIGYEDHFSYDTDQITTSLVGNTAQAVSVTVDDPVANGFFFRVGANGQISDTVSLDVDYGLALNDGDGETHSGKIRIKVKR